MIIIAGKIRGKQRPKVYNRHAVTPEETINYENWVRLCYQQQGGEFLKGYLKAEIVAYYKIPKSYPKKRIQTIKDGLEYPDKKPDSDNIAKIILDALNGIAYEDDKQVIDLSVKKRYTEEKERVEINLEIM